MAKKQKIIYAIVLMVALGLLVVPLFTHNRMYISVTTAPDTIYAFMPAINDVVGGMSFWMLADNIPYFGLTVTMWCLGILVKATHISPEIIFMIYALTVLFLVGFTLYRLGTLINGRRTGWLVLAFALLCNTSILGLFSYACIFNIINVYIIFLWAIIFGVKWMRDGRWYQMVGSIILLLLFAILHPTGVYLLFPLLSVAIWFFIWHWRKYHRYNWIYTALILLAFAGVAYLVKTQIGMVQWGISSWGEYWDYLFDFARFILQPISTAVWLLVIVGLVMYRKAVVLDDSMRAVLLILGSVIVMLLGACVLRLIQYTDRLMVDAGAMLSIIVALMLGYLAGNPKLEWLKVSSYTLICLGSLVTLRAWVI